MSGNPLDDTPRYVVTTEATDCKAANYGITENLIVEGDLVQHRLHLEPDVIAAERIAKGKHETAVLDNLGAGGAPWPIIVNTLAIKIPGQVKADRLRYLVVEREARLLLTRAGKHEPRALTAVGDLMVALSAVPGQDERREVARTVAAVLRMSGFDVPTESSLVGRRQLYAASGYDDATPGKHTPLQRIHAALLGVESWSDPEVFDLLYEAWTDAGRPLPTLKWEAAASDEPGDQNATTEYTPRDCSVAFYEVGPDGDRWSLALTGLNEGDEVFHVVIDRFDTEAEAKGAAQRIEDSGQLPIL